VRARAGGFFALGFVVIAAVRASAQAPTPPQNVPPPAPGFVPAFEVMRTVRAAGFDPLAPPLREGTIYVVRATDFRGILMRVVVDARTGAIRDANRIVPGPGPYGPGPGPLGMAPADALPPADIPPASGRPPHPDVAPPPIAPSAMPALPPPVTSAVSYLPPLPRPRPAALAASKPADDAKPAAALDPKPADNATTAAPAAPAKPSKAPSQLLIAN